MKTSQRQSHWQNVYQTKGEREVSWFQESPEISLELIHNSGVHADASIIDIGGGSSRLVDRLLDAEFTSITVLDLSENALETSKARLGTRCIEVDWMVADVTAWQPSQTYDIWHDRAAFHFLTDENDQVSYAERVKKAVKQEGYVIIGTFALDGPERCSGLPVVRHDAKSIGKVLGISFVFLDSRMQAHQTPGGVTQEFQFNLFRRKRRNDIFSSLPGRSVMNGLEAAVESS